MRLCSMLAACAAVLAFGPPAPAAEGGLPLLGEPVKITAGGVPIAVDIGHASPFVVDINRDGKKDLLVGQFGGGKCRVYLNKGTDASPRLDGFTYLQAAGAEATVPPS